MLSIANLRPQDGADYRRLMDENETAERLGLSPRTLQAWRVRGGGPQYVKIGRSVRYDPRVIDAWLEARLFAHTASAA